MSIKELIKCLTIIIALLPSYFSYGAVKDILNIKKHSSLLIHSHQLITEVSQLTFPDNKYDGKQIIVIDAGHGGHDPGTHGKHSKEKDIALKIALNLGQEIKKQSSNIHIIYTRDRDIFIPLHERIGLANREKADLFVSIHCNYVGNPNICGTETYVMGLHRAEDNLNVAKRENSSILLESEYETNYEGYDPNSPVGHILLSMIQNVFLDNSIEVASKIESQFISRKKTKSRGVKQAGFVVLRQATMPSILVETGFLSNAKEEKYLMSKKGQTEMAKGISTGIISYFQENKPTQAVTNITPKTEQIPSTQSDVQNTTQGKYVIQIGVFSALKGEKYTNGLKNYGKLIVEHEGSVHKYSIGYFSNKKDAQEVSELLNSSGYQGAFIKIRI